jgi:putative endonuclease
VYILFSRKNGVLYTGVTNDLVRRLYEHKNKLTKGFTKKYDVDKLGYYQLCEDIDEAIIQEKKIKGGSRNKKIGLIEEFNPDWKDLYESII